MSNAIFSDESKLFFFRFKITEILIYLIYLLPFSFFIWHALPFSKIPYTYLLLFIFTFGAINNLRYLKIKLNYKLLSLFSLSLLWMFISCLFNENYSFSSIIGIGLRTLTILLGTLFTIDIRKIFKHLVNSIPLYLITLLFVQKLDFFEAPTVNANVLSGTFTSIVLLIFVLKNKFDFNISLKNYIWIFFSSSIILILTESRGVILSLSLSIFLISFIKFLRKFFINFVISKRALKFIALCILIIFIYIISIFGLNRSNEYTLSRYYFLDNSGQSNDITKGIASDRKRFFLLTYALKDIKEKPFLGYGSGNNQEVFKKVRENNYEETRRALHNTYLSITYQYGIPALILLILFCRVAININYLNYNNISFQLFILFNVLNGFFNDAYAKNYFIFILILLSIGYRLVNPRENID